MRSSANAPRAGGPLSPTAPTAHVDHSPASPQVDMASPATIDQDPVLLAVRAGLPTGWSMRIDGTALVFERAAAVWVLPENKINAMASTESEAQRGARIRSHGQRAHPMIVYPVEPRWTPRKIRQTLARNREIQAKLQELGAKYGVADLLREATHTKPGDPRIGASEAQLVRLEPYVRERTALEARLRRLPVWQTSRLALFERSHRAWSDAMTSVAPYAAAEDCYAADERVQALLRRHADRISPCDPSLRCDD